MPAVVISVRMKSLLSRICNASYFRSNLGLPILLAGFYFIVPCRMGELAMSPVERSRLWSFDSSLPTMYAKPWQENARRYASIISPYLVALVPRYMRKGGLHSGKQPHITSYLDALRGIAAVIVVNHHHMPYNRTWLVQQPFFHLINSGRGSKGNLFFGFRLAALIQTRFQNSY